MANVVNRTTKQYMQSVNTPDFPVGEWIIDPDLSAVVGFDTKYWIITGDTITLMDQAARDAVDTTELAAQRDQIANELDKTQDTTVEFFKLVIDEVNTLRAQFNTTTAEVAQLTDTTFTPRTMAQLKTALRAALDE